MVQYRNFFRAGLGLASFVVALYMSVSSTLGQSATEPKFELTGVWAGVAYLDESKLEEKLKTLRSDAERQDLLNKARGFLNIIGAFEFKANGEFESDFEINVGEEEGPREIAQGKFRIVESEGLKRVIELIKNDRKPDDPADKRLVQFYEDGQHMAMAIPAPSALVEFNPLMIFERVPPEELADPTIIANEQKSKSSTIK